MENLLGGIPVPEGKLKTLIKDLKKKINPWDLEREEKLKLEAERARGREQTKAVVKRHIDDKLAEEEAERRKRKILAPSAEGTEALHQRRHAKKAQELAEQDAQDEIGQRIEKKVEEIRQRHSG